MKLLMKFIGLLLMPNSKSSKREIYWKEFLSFGGTLIQEYLISVSSGMYTQSEDFIFSSKIHFFITNHF
jgi:hypothetical protein